MSTSRSTQRGEIPSYYTSSTQTDTDYADVEWEYEDEDDTSGAYVARARYSTLSTHSTNLDVAPPPLPPKPISIHSTTSKSSTGSGSIGEAVPLTATRGRRASASSHHLLLSRPSTSLSLFAPQPSAVCATEGGNAEDDRYRDDRSVAPSPSHSSIPPRPHSNTSERTRPDSTSAGSSPEVTANDRTQNSNASTDMTTQHLAPSSHLDDVTPSPNRLSTTSARSARTHLAAALAALPWAEPPPRSHSVSPAPSASTSSMPVIASTSYNAPTFPTSVTGSFSSTRSPSYAFLQDDPATSAAGFPLGRTQSRASSRLRETGSIGLESRRSSLGSVHTPPAEAAWMATVLSHAQAARADPGGSQPRPTSGYSGMADVDVDIGSSSNHQLSEESLIRSLSAAIRRLSRSPMGMTVRSNKSNKSGKSGKSSKSSTGPSGTKKSVRSVKSKRASESTIGHRFGGKRWSIDREGQEPLVGGSRDEWAEVDLKQREADLDLLALVGRAAVLERMLRAGKRVSNSTIRQAGRLSAQSFSNRFDPAAPSRSSLRPPHSSRPSASSRYSIGSIRNSQSHNGTPRTSFSLRQRLSRRIRRKSSREDIFTELSDNPSVERLASEEQAEGGDQGNTASGGVMVFPERISLPPPPIPAKPPRNRDGVTCTDIVCLSPTSPTPFFDYSQMEKGELPPGDTSDVRPTWVEQSPHLGHRSPNWRNRRSVISYISTGHWDGKARKRWLWTVLVGAGLVLIVIVGLLGGLLSRR